MPTRLIDSTPPATTQVVLPGHDLRGPEVHRIEAGGAEPVDLHAGHVGSVVRREGRRARDVAARFADRIDATEHDVVHACRVEAVAILERAQQPWWRAAASKPREVHHPACRVRAGSARDRR